MAERERLCAGRVDSWSDGEVRRIEGEPPIALYYEGGAFHATGDWCTHDKASLAEGYFEDGVVECPWHMARFCVRTGKALSAPAYVDLQCFTVEIVDGEVFVIREAEQ